MLYKLQYNTIKILNISDKRSHIQTYQLPALNV